MKTNRSKLTAALLLLGLLVLTVAGTKISKLTRTATLSSSNDLFVVVTGATTKVTRHIQAHDLGRELAPYITNVAGVSLSTLLTTSNSIIYSSVQTNAINEGNVLYVRTNGNDSTAVRGRLDKPWARLTNAAIASTVGDLIDVGPGTYIDPTNSEISLLRGGVNWRFDPAAKYCSGTVGDGASYGIPFNDWSGAVTSIISGFGTFSISNDAGNLLNITNPNSVVVFQFHRAETFNGQGVFVQDGIGGGGDLTLYFTDGIYSSGADSYDAYINQANPNTSKLRVYGPKVIGGTGLGDSSFEFSAGFTSPGDCIIRVASTRGDFTLVDNMDAELGVLALGANNVVYSPLNQTGNGILRNTYIYGDSNRIYSLIQTPSDSGLFATSGTFDNDTFVGPTNRPVALLTNQSAGRVTFNGGRFFDGFGATNSIRSKNAQSVALNNLKLDLGLHANVTATGATNYHSTIKSAKILNTGTIDSTGVINANGGIDVQGGDLNILGANSFTTGGSADITGDANVTGNITLSSVDVSKNIGYTEHVIAGVGGANTNFTLLAEYAKTIINGFTNVSLRAIMGGTDGRTYTFSITITNGSGSDRTLEFSSVTNDWKWSYAQGATAPTVLTNSEQIVISGELRNTNITAAFAYYPWP